MYHHVCRFLLLATFCSVGCAPQSVPKLPPELQARQPVEQVITTPTNSVPAQREFWSAIYMQDQKVGHSHVTIRAVKEGGETLIHTRNRSELTLNREGSRLTQRLELQSWETPAGRVHRFESRMTSGPGEIVAQGKAAEGGMIVTTDTVGKKVTRFVACPQPCGGYFAVDQSLEKSPLKPGETRMVAGLVPIFNQAGEAKLTAMDEEEVSLRGLKQKLLKIKNEITIAGQTLTSYCWINAKGEVLKTYDPTFQQESILTTKEFALQKNDLGKIDLLAATTVPLKGKLPETRPVKQALYLARLQGEQKIADQFANDEFQQTEMVDDSTVKLKVAELDRSSPVDKTLRGELPVTDDSTANSLVQSDDPAVIQLAQAIAGQKKEPLAVALALEQGVRQHIHKRNYAQAFATAAEVVRSQEGDCTEHAVLLAAVCRARQIPARVVLGLVFYPQQKGFAYHMWNEVWIGDRWLPLDATVAQGTVGADHIKLRHANLQGESAYAVMLPLLQVVGKLELEVVEAE